MVVIVAAEPTKAKASAKAAKMFFMGFVLSAILFSLQGGRDRCDAYHCFGVYCRRS